MRQRDTIAPGSTAAASGREASRVPASMPPLVVLGVVVLALVVVMGACSSSEDAATTVALTGAAATGQETVRDLGCTTCHTADGSDGVGPTFKGLAGSQVELDGGRTVKADDAYLRRSIEKPSAQVVKGFRPMMPERDLTDAQVSSIVAYLQAIGSKG